MLQGVTLGIAQLGMALVRGPEGPELYALLSLAGIGLSLLLLFLMLKRRRSRAEAREDRAEQEPVQPPQEIAVAQAELRELVQGFSALAGQMIRAFERGGEGRNLADPQSRVRELLTHGLNPTEVARATGLSLGEVALVMNLHKAQLGNGGSSHGQVEEPRL